MKTKFNLLDSSYLPLLRRLWSHISERRRYQLLFLVILMVIVSFMEIVSIGLVLPFLGALTAPEIILNSAYISPFIKLAGIEKPSEILLPLTITFISSTLVTG